MDIKPIKISALNERFTGTSEISNISRDEEYLISGGNWYESVGR